MSTFYVCAGPTEYDNHREQGHAVVLKDDLLNGSDLDASRIILAGHITREDAGKIRDLVGEEVRIVHESDLADFNMVLASNLEARKPTWVWENMLPRGMMSMWTGDPMAGKTFVALDIIARVTTGRAMPDGSAGIGPLGVLIVSYDDAPAETIKPRLIGAGADCSKVIILDGNLGGRGESRRVHASDFEAMILRAQDQLARNHTRLGMILMDPMSALLAGTDSHMASAVYGMLGNLVGYCHQEDVAALILAHTGKADKGKAINSATGSQAQAGAARSMAMFARDDANDERLILPAKSSISRMVEGFRFTIEDVPIDQYDDAETLKSAGFSTLPRVRWLGGSGMNAQEWLDQQAAAESPSKGQDAIRVALTCLGKGVRAAKDIEAAAAAEGITKSTLQSATKNIGIVKCNTSYGWLWGFPTETREQIINRHLGRESAA